QSVVQALEPVGVSQAAGVIDANRVEGRRGLGWHERAPGSDFVGGVPEISSDCMLRAVVAPCKLTRSVLLTMDFSEATTAVRMVSSSIPSGRWCWWGGSRLLPGGRRGLLAARRAPRP